MSEAREFYENSSVMKSYRRARFWHDYERKKVNRISNAYLTQKNPPHIKADLQKARLKEVRLRHRQQMRKDKINRIKNSSIVHNKLLQYCIIIVLIMTFITFNLTGEITIETQIDNPPYHLQEINYTQEYKNSFYEETTALNKLTNMAEAFTKFGQNTTWSMIINEFANKDSTSNSLLQIGKIVTLVIFFPLNEVINIGTLFINLINGWIGKQLIEPITFKFMSIIDAEPIDVIFLPNLFK